MCIKIDPNKSIKLDSLDLSIKSYGYQYSIIDYGSVINSKYELSSSELKKYKLGLKYNYDMNIFFMRIITHVSFIKTVKYIPIHKITMDKLRSTNNKLYLKIKSQIIKIYPEMSKYYYLYEKKHNVNNELFIQFGLFLSIYDRDFLAECFDKPKEEPLTYPIEHLEFILNNMKTPKLIIQYLYKLIE
jgi:hypothetical protein